MRVAIIPARGGSKRIPRKNVKLFAGKPMIAHSIERARESGLFDRVIVSTDDEDVGAVSREYGVEVPFMRPAALSDDHATTTAVIAHAVEWLRAEGANPTTVCCLYATAPFVSVADLRAGCAALEGGDWNYVFAATDFAYSIFRSFRRVDGGGVEMFFPEHFTTRSQDLPQAYHDAGQFYWGRADAWVEQRRVFAPQSTVVLLSRARVQDIDTPEDWERAEALHRFLQADAAAGRWR